MRRSAVRIRLEAQKAKVAQLVEHDLAKVGVASSNLVFRSNIKRSVPWITPFLYLYWMGKHDSLNIFINVKTHIEFKNYAQIIHLYYTENVFNKSEVELWLGEAGCEFHSITKNKIVFTYFDGFFPTRVTIYQSGNIRVETDLDQFP